MPGSGNHGMVLLLDHFSLSSQFCLWHSRWKSLKVGADRSTGIRSIFKSFLKQICWCEIIITVHLVIFSPYVTSKVFYNTITKSFFCDISLLPRVNLEVIYISIVWIGPHPDFDPSLGWLQRDILFEAQSLSVCNHCFIYWYFHVWRVFTFSFF